MKQSLLQSDMFAPTARKPPIELHPRHFADVDHRALLAEIRPVQYEYRMFGTTGPRPRLERWIHRDRRRTYTFGGGKPINPEPFGPALRALTGGIVHLTGQLFDSCFANYYRTGQDYIDWHADDEDWIGPYIASASFGGSRVMKFRAKSDHSLTWSVTLDHGDLLVMLPGCQETYEHTILKKSAGRCRPRLNLTIRQTI